MEISKSLESSALESLAAAASLEEAPELIPVTDTPFFLSLTGKGIMPHAKVEYLGVEYYIGTKEAD